ncbi:TPA: hypothetical protein ACGKFT_006459, partial [Pseudomonas aeruginosa]
RGNLNQACIYLKEKEKLRLTISVEYFLEYQATGFELRMSSALWLGPMVPGHGNAACALSLGSLPFAAD